jgi:hypothetical protein
MQNLLQRRAAVSLIGVLLLAGCGSVKQTPAYSSTAAIPVATVHDDIPATAGRDTYFNVLTMQADWYDAERALVSARLDCPTGLIELLSTSGGRSPANAHPKPMTNM